jgi:hypothetical protein
MADINQIDSRRRRQLRSLLLAVGVSAALVVFAPIVFHTVFGFPWFSLQSWLGAGAVTFALAIPAFWAAFTRRSDFTGRMALVAGSVILLVAAFIAWRFH